MVGWHHQLKEHEFEQALVVGEGQGSPVCCSSQGQKESDTTEQLNNNKNVKIGFESWSNILQIINTGLFQN